MSYKKDKWDELERLRDRLLFLHNCELDPPRHKEELAILDKILKLDPEDKVAWTFKGDVLFELGREDFYDKLTADKKNCAYESLQSYENALELDGNYIWAVLGKGNVLLLLSRYEGAIRCYDKIIGMDEPIDIAWFNKGLALNNLKRYDEALRCYDIFASLEVENKDDQELLYRKYETLMKMGRKGEAVACYELAFDCKPIEYMPKWKKYLYVGFGVFFTTCFIIRFML